MPQSAIGIKHAASPLLEECQFLAMGTAVQVSVAIAAEAQRAAAQQAIAEVRKLLREFGHEGWAWGSGALASFNRSLSLGQAAAVPPLLHRLLARAWDIHQASGGLFEPRIGALVRLWGFDEATRLRSAPPPSREIAAALSQLHAAPPYDGAAWYGPAPGIAWDLGAIGKGYIADLALDWLRHRGFASAIVNAGGNVAVRGSRGDRPWQVGIRDPRCADQAADLLAVLAACDESVVTHGGDQRGFEYQGRRYAHLLHPRSGMPVQGLRSLSVVHQDGTLADAGGAALFAAGVEGWRELAGQLGIEQVLVLTDEGALLATEALAARLQVQAAMPVAVAH